MSEIKTLLEMAKRLSADLKTGVKKSVLHREVFSFPLQHREGREGFDGSGDSDVQEEILHGERSADLLYLVFVFVHLHEEDVRNILLLSALNHVGKLRSVFCGDQYLVLDKGHALVGDLPG